MEHTISADNVKQLETANTIGADIPSGALQARQAAGGLSLGPGGKVASPLSPTAGAAIGGLTFVNGINGLAVGARKLFDGLAAGKTGDAVEGGAQGTQGLANIAQGGAGVAEQALRVAAKTAPTLESAANIAGKVGQVGGVVAGVADIVGGGYKVITESDLAKRASGGIDVLKGGLGVAGAVAGGTAAPILGAASAGLQTGKLIGESGAELANEISAQHGYFGKDPFSTKGKNLTAEGDAALKNLATKQAVGEKLEGLRVGNYALGDTAVDVLSTGAGLAHGTAASLKNTAYTLGRRGFEKLRALF